MLVGKNAGIHETKAKFKKRQKVKGGRAKQLSIRKKPLQHKKKNKKKKPSQYVTITRKKSMRRTYSFLCQSR